MAIPRKRSMARDLREVSMAAIDRHVVWTRVARDLTILPLCRVLHRRCHGVGNPTPREHNTIPRLRPAPGGRRAMAASRPAPGYYPIPHRSEIRLNAHS